MINDFNLKFPFIRQGSKHFSWYFMSAIYNTKTQNENSSQGLQVFPNRKTSQPHLLILRVSWVHFSPQLSRRGEHMFCIDVCPTQYIL